MSEDNNTTDGPSSETTILAKDNVIDFSKFKKNREEGKQTLEEKGQWPSAVPKIDPKDLKVSATDPSERRILLSLTHGDVIVSGHLGLSQTFIAVGDAQGRIKFAAAPGLWQYARDITDDAVEPTTAA